MKILFPNPSLLIIMKLSKVLHVLSVIAGVAGVVALVGAYIAGPSGTMFGFTQNHLFVDAGLEFCWPFGFSSQQFTI